MNLQTITQVRELTPSDLGMLESGGAASTIPVTKSIKAVHHRAAKLVAAGWSPAKISEIVPLSAMRIYQLKTEPLFNDLVAHYASEIGERDQAQIELENQVKSRLTELGVMVTEELVERLLDSPEAIPTKDLTQLLSTSLDRAGFSPQAKTTVSVGLNSETISALKAALGDGGVTGKVYDVQDFEARFGNSISDGAFREAEAHDPGSEGRDLVPAEGGD